MKRIILFVFVVVLHQVALAQTFELNGKITGLTSDSLLLLKAKGKVFEAAKIKVKNGSFNYTEPIAEPYFVQLFKLKKGTNDTDGKLTEFMVAPGKISITGHADLFNAIKIEGSEPDKILKTYLKEDELLAKKWEKWKEEYDTYVASGDTVGRKKVGLALNNILLKERVPLLKKYVRANSNTIVGALLPNFCTLKDVLKKEDYLEMYTALTPSMRQSDYGKDLFKKTN
jgi:hypothetical protein